MSGFWSNLKELNRETIGDIPVDEVFIVVVVVVVVVVVLVDGVVVVVDDVGLSCITSLFVNCWIWLELILIRLKISSNASISFCNRKVL